MATSLATKERKHRWYIANRAREIARRQQWRKDNALKQAEYMRQWAQDNPENIVQNNRKQTLRRYSLTPEAFDAMLEAQGGVCAICGTDQWGGHGGKPHVDHSHETHKVRSLLCQHCNFILGHAKDNPDILLKAAAYLEKF